MLLDKDKLKNFHLKFTAGLLTADCFVCLFWVKTIIISQMKDKIS